jgi:hypothetical protein
LPGARPSLPHLQRVASSSPRRPPPPSHPSVRKYPPSISRLHFFLRFPLHRPSLFLCATTAVLHLVISCVALGPIELGSWVSQRVFVAATNETRARCVALQEKCVHRPPRLCTGGRVEAQRRVDQRPTSATKSAQCAHLAPSVCGALVGVLFLCSVASSRRWALSANGEDGDNRRMAAHPRVSISLNGIATGILPRGHPRSPTRVEDANLSSPDGDVVHAHWTQCATATCGFWRHRRPPTDTRSADSQPAAPDPSRAAAWLLCKRSAAVHLAPNPPLIGIRRRLAVAKSSTPPSRTRRAPSTVSVQQ